MVASDPQDAAESQPWLWSDLLMGLLSGASCQVQKVPTSYGEVVDVVREKGSRPPPGNAFADSALDSSEASPAVTTQSETVPTELGFDKEDQPHSDDGAHSGSTDANSPANESHEVSAESPPDISQIKVFAYAPGSLASCGNNELARQCCHKLCHAPCTGVDVVDPAQGFQPSQQVLVHDGAGILEPRQNRENKAGEVMPAFREAFAEAVAEAAGVSVSRVRVLDVGPPLQGQQDSEDEDDSEAATDIRPAIAGEAELAESEEELGSSSTIVPVVDSPSTAARPALSAHPPAETEADKLHEASLAPTQEMSGAGSRAENGKTSEIAEASKEDADRIVLSPREATIAETTPQELNGLEALSETTTADHFELSQAADTTSVTTEAGSILEGLSAAERPMTAGLEASDDTLPVQEVPEVRESQVESKRETPVQHPGSDEDSRKEVEAAEAEATTTVAERYGGSAAARTKKSGEAKMQQHIGKEAGATAANVCRKDASFEVFAQTPKESHEDEGGKSSMAHDDKMKVYAGATEEACSVEAKRKSGAGAEAIRAASEGEEKEAAGTEAKWNCHDGTKVAKRAKPVESEFAAPGEVKTTRAEAESSGQEQIGAATKVEVQAQWKDSEKAEGERSEYSEQEKTETAATPGNETRKVDAEQKTQARTEAAEAEASWQQVKEAEEAARAAGEACLDGAGQGAYADAAAVNEEEACTGREEAGEAGGHADEACQVEADQKVHEKAETTCQQAQQIDEIERPAMRACNAETDGETPKEAGAAEAHVQDDCEDAARAAEEACKVESWRRTCGNTQAAKAMQDDAENPEEEQPSKQSHCRGKDESLHASRMAADKMVTWEEDLGEGGDARESGKARPVAVSDVEQQDCLNLNSPAVVLETPAPMSPATGSPSPESPAEFKGRLARRERRASLSQGLR
eukprot:TRINITY_DN13741_c0_g1_i2.p1 TRINITY_DN13741_c0_g1~~TRINITY_DN13741_c0_g1_i2.p1  ORF type:complete len:924 (-),score=257.34 TRINITY_DN13741_c0_g1_i2:291-3062(-)